MRITPFVKKLLNCLYVYTLFTCQPIWALNCKSLFSNHYTNSIFSVSLDLYTKRKLMLDYSENAKDDVLMPFLNFSEITQNLLKKLISESQNGQREVGLFLVYLNDGRVIPSDIFSSDLESQILGENSLPAFRDVIKKVDSNSIAKIEIHHTHPHGPSLSKEDRLYANSIYIDLFNGIYGIEVNIPIYLFALYINEPQLLDMYKVIQANP